MRDNPVVGVIGGTGLVGSELLSLMEQEPLPMSKLRVLASAESAGELYSVAGSEVSVELLTPNALQDIDVAVFAAGPEVSSTYLPLARKHGARCIDTSVAFGESSEAQIICSEVNGRLLNDQDTIWVSASAATVQLCAVANIIRESAGLKRLVVSTYHSCSGAGKAGLDELWDQTLAILNQKEIEQSAFPHQIAFNCFPQVDLIDDRGDSLEERRMVRESRSVLGMPALGLCCTAVRIPVMYSHCQSVNIETQQPFALNEVIEKLEQTAGLRVYRDSAEYPMPLSVSGSDEIHVGRIRRDTSVPDGLTLWTVADNVRRSAARNVLGILERLLSEHSH